MIIEVFFFLMISFINKVVEIVTESNSGYGIQTDEKEMVCACMGGGGGGGVGNTCNSLVM